MAACIRSVFAAAKLPAVFPDFRHKDFYGSLADPASFGSTLIEKVKSAINECAHITMQREAPGPPDPVSDEEDSADDAPAPRR